MQTISTIGLDIAKSVFQVRYSAYQRRTNRPRLLTPKCRDQIANWRPISTT